MVISRVVISPLIWVITIATLLLTPLITTHAPPSNVIPFLAFCCCRCSNASFGEASPSVLANHLASVLGLG